MDDFTIELIEDFIAECSDLIEESEPNLLSADCLTQELASNLFRPVHSLKGTSASLGFNHIVSAVHEAENLLSIFQKGECVSENDKYRNFFLTFFDFIRDCFAVLGSEYSDEACATASVGIIEEAKTLVEELFKENSDEGGEVEEVAEEEPVVSTIELEETEAKPKTELELGPLPEITPESDLVAGAPITIEIDQEMIDSFIAESRDIFTILEEKLLALSQKPDDMEYVQETFRQIHSFKGNCGIFSLADLEKLSHRTENVLGAVVSGELASTSKLYDAIIPIVDVLKEGAENLSSESKGTVEHLELYLELLDSIIAEKKGTPKTETKPGPESEIELKIEQGQEDVAAPAEEAPKTVLTQEPPVASTKPMPPNRKDAKAGAKAAENKVKPVEMKRQDIRVDVNKLDVLNNLVGELVTIKTMILELFKHIAEKDQADKTFRLFDRVTTDLQDISMSIRMIPVAGLFKKMIRIVHDISIKSKKKIDFSFTGEETEIDKTVIEKIGDPLVHMIRNAVDHGIEPEDVREKLGKPRQGKVTLSARNEASEIWIVLRDDGKGLNRDAILAKAKANGLIEDDGKDLTDSEVFNFIFAAGFSTAKEVTDVSGRGVGMDVVKTNIENIKGKVDIVSVPDKGTTFTIKIPLTLAVIQGMMLEVGDTNYTLPIELIRESVKIERLKVTNPMEDQEIVEIRGEMLSVLRLSELHNIPTDIKKVEDGILVIVESRGKKLALLIDRLIGQYETVVKPLPKYFKQIKGVSGCSILGNGDASLILDVSTLIDLARQKNERTEVNNIR